MPQNIGKPATISETLWLYVRSSGIKTRFELEAKNSQGEGAAKMPNLLITGPAGSGRTAVAIFLAETVSKRSKSGIALVDGKSIRKSADLCGLLTNLEDSEVLLFDNIDELSPPFVEHLVTAVVELALDVVIDQGPGARSVRLNLPQFSLVATATTPTRLPPMLRVVFRIVEELDPYSRAELADITRLFARDLSLQLSDHAVEAIINTANGTPSAIEERVRLVHAFAKIHSCPQPITAAVAADALEILPTPLNSAASQERQISSEVRREVWRRDGGKCARCGSRQKLEYDHIIPVSRGGSNTARNIELLCEACNRSKRDSIE